MSLLERRYRSVLRLLPASYRAEREEEMVDAFMELSGDVPDEEGPRPRWGEVAGVLALSVRVRLGGAGASSPYVAVGAAVRLLALLGLATQAAFALAGLIQTLPSGLHPVLAGEPGSAQRLAAIAGLGAGACAVAAVVALLRGHVPAAKLLAVAGVAPAAASFVPTWQAGAGALQNVAHLVFAVVPVLALLVGYHGDVTPRRHRWALVLPPLAAGAAVLVTPTLLYAATPASPSWLFLWVHLGSVIPVWAVAALAVLARRSGPAPALALSAAGLLLLMTRLPELRSLPEATLRAMAVAQCALLATLTVALAVAGARALAKARPLPAARP
ncbi:hypothetical protein [Nonomuraea candida]|uniref:hypothetical protein n=1 Tax=Nonomuraea candida TaxID=359159 RepID=UPI0005BBD96A|nr:hypothetical protein [Nonomuraea candida]